MVIAKTVYKVSDFLTWKRDGVLDLSPSFQRRPVWPSKAKSYLMDTIIKELPMPIIFLREQIDMNSLITRREVVDGQQRLRTIISFIDPKLLSDFDEKRDKFTLINNHNPEYSGFVYEKLPEGVRRKILNYDFSVHVLPPETEDSEVLQIFARMNSTGVKLNHQELRNAEYFGSFKRTAYKIAYENLNYWRDWKIFSEDQIARMEEVEEVSDLLSIMIYGVKGKSQTNINKLYKKFENNFPYSDELEKRFRIIIERINENIGDQIVNTEFSKHNLFNSLFVVFYDLLFGLGTPIEKTATTQLPNYRIKLLQINEDLKERDLPEELLKVLRGATANQESRLLRFEYIKSKMLNA